MFDNYTDSIISNTEKTVLSGKNQVSLGEILDTKLPNFLKNFFDREVEQWLQEEYAMYRSSGRFEYDMPEVRKLQEQMNKALKRTARFHRNRFMRLVERAVKLQANILARPHQTLEQFVFKDEDEVNTSDVLKSLQYFSDYGYYAEAIKKIFERDKKQEVNKFDLKKYIREIDDKLFEKNTKEMISQWSKPMIDYYLAASGKKDIVITDMLAQAFRDRNMPRWYDAMKFGVDKGKESIPFNDIFSLYQMYEKQLSEMADAERRAKETSEQKMRDEAERKLREEEAAAVAKAAEPEDILAGIGEAEEVQSLAEFEKQQKTAGAPALTAAEELAMHIASKISSDKPLESLKKLINPDDEKRFIKKMFNKKTPEYAQFIANLEAVSDWKTASQYIDDEFYNRSVNPYSKEAIAFTDIAYQRYFPKDKYVGGGGAAS
jgi:hypothetical protein